MNRRELPVFRQGTAQYAKSKPRAYIPYGRDPKTLQTSLTERERYTLCDKWWKEMTDYEDELSRA